MTTDRTRRTILAAIAATPAAALPAPAETMELDRLIGAHGRAHAAFVVAVDKLEIAQHDHTGPEANVRLEAAEARLLEANEVERAALLAVCSYPCQTIGDARAKAAYLASTPAFSDMAGELTKALIASFSSEPGA
jgi:hypothetical protein